MICYYMSHASLTALMNCKSGGGMAKIYSFYLGNPLMSRERLTEPAGFSAQGLLIANNEDHESLG